MHVHVRLLGRFEVAVDGDVVPPGSWRRQAGSQLVKLLALQPGHRLLRDRVVDMLWPDLELDKTPQRLHAATHYARTALGPSDSVVASRGVIALFPDADLTVDTEGFERAAEAARELGSPQAAADAADLYAGHLLPDDLYEPWTDEPRERLRMRYRELLRTAGRYDALVADDPLDEDAQLAMVRDLVRQGRRQDALRALDRMADLFERELGVAPGPDAITLRSEAERLTAGSIPEPPEPPEYDGSPSPRRTSLPAARTRLVGRTDDLARTADLLDSYRLVTIAGPGGAGKSTLALAHARQASSDPAGDRATSPATNPASNGSTDVVLAELAPAREPSDVTRVVAEAAGVQGEGAIHPAKLAATLGRRPLLLVLDNCEHLLDACAELVDAILDAGTDTRVLATSREPLRVDGEAVHRIGSLGAEAAQLFVERAEAAAGPGVATPDDPKVHELCKRLDGLPLAIELAAAQLDHLTLSELVDRLDDRLALLAGGRPKAGDRHSALAATIDWSYRLLPEDARDLFSRLGVFPASFDLEAAAAVSDAADHATVTATVGDLVAKSLVVHDAVRGRYHLLETIRLFAAERLEESQRTAAVTERLRQHVVRRARSMPRVRAWLSTSLAARSRDDLDNVRLAFDTSLAAADHTAAVDVALAISTLWRNAVSYEEGRQWVTALLDRDLEPADRTWALFLSADVALGSGDTRAMRAAATKASGAHQDLDDPSARVLATMYDALAHLIDPARASRRLTEASELARAADEPGLERLVRGFRLVTRRLQGPDPALAEEARELVDTNPGRDYDRYICLWGASMLTLVDRDGARLRQLMDEQVRDLMASELRENWLTMYWGALALVAEHRDFRAQLRVSRRQAQVEGRSVEPDSVLALAYDAACRDDWERAAELIGAVGDRLRNDTAGYMHLTLIRDQLVRPQLDPETFTAATQRGSSLDLDELLTDHDL